MSKLRPPLCTRVLGVLCLGLVFWLSAITPCRAQSASQSLAQVTNPTVIPTDVVPLSSHRENIETMDAFKMRLWQHLPASFYFTTSIESTFRLETNPYQYPMKRQVLEQLLPVGTNISDVSPSDMISDIQTISHASAGDLVNRINPTVTSGWAITPNTQVFGTYFLIRDSLFHNSQINSTTQAVGMGAQHTYNLGRYTTLQPQFIVRELWQTAEPPVLDYLPAINLQTNLKPNLTAYVNALLQLRFLRFIGDPMRELDPMYSGGFIWQRGRWTFINTCTYLQNYRKMFGKNSLLPVNNNSFILDFEIDRQIFKRIPGLQAIVRAEPVYNYGSHNTLGISGMDFRLYWGLRFSAFKPWLNGSMEQLRKRYQLMEEPNP